MATIDQLHTALVNADAAGDTAAATALAQEIQRVSSAPAAAPAASGYQQEAPPLMARVGRGFMDAGQGLKQLYLMATNPDEAKQYTAEKNQEEALYTKGRGPDAGIDWARLGGNVAAGTALAAPMMAMLPEAATAGVVGRLATQAGIGATQGAANFDPSGTWSGKALQTGVGGIAGAGTQALGEVAAPLMGKVASGVRQGVEAVKNRVTGAMDPANVASDLRGVVPGFDTMPPAQQQSIIDQVIATRGSGKDVIDAPALARQADAKSLGMTLTKGQATRDPNQFYAESEAAKLRGVGDPLQQTFVEQNQQLLTKIPELQKGTGSAAATPYQAAEQAREAVQQFASQTQKSVGKLYDAARQTVGVTSEVPLAPIADSVGKVADEYGVEHLAGAVGNRLKSYGLLGGDKTKSLDVAGAEQLRKFIGNNIDPMNKAQTAALKEIQGSIDAAVSSMGDGLGGEAGAAFRTARQAASQRFEALAPTPVKRLAQVEEAAPNFLQTNVLGGKPGELAGLKSVLLQSNPDAWNGLRAQTLQHLADKATLGDAQGLFSGARFGKALDAIGMDRLKVLFNDQELSQLGAIKRTAHAITVQPPRSNVNNSNTASTLSNLMASQAAGPGMFGRALSMIPGAGHVLVGGYQAGKGALEKGALQRAAQEAANPGAQAFAQSPLTSDAARQLVARLLMRPSALTAPLALGAFRNVQSGP